MSITDELRTYAKGYEHKAEVEANAIAAWNRRAGDE